jgi:hypothetical protein
MLGRWTRGEVDQGPAAVLTAPVRITWTAETWTWLAVAVGVIFRLAEYLDNRRLYMDELSLLKNLMRLPVFDFSTRLTENQLAPPGFLVVERLMVRLPFPTVGAARFVPLVCGIASMFLMRSVARRYLTPRAVPIAVGLFALNDWLLYYACEIKQYSSDVALTLVALLLAAAPAVMSRRGLFVLAGFGVVGVWFSHPLALVLGAVGTYLVGKAVIRKDWKGSLCLMGMGLLWASSFATCYFVSHRILTKDRFIWDWWGFAFLPLPPHSLADLERDGWHLLNILNNPSGVVTPLGVLHSAFLALGLLSLGAVSLGLKWRGRVYLLLAPVLFTLLASALHQYPFHGRLLLFLVPSVHLLIGEGAAALSRRGGVLFTCALGAFLLFQPARDAFWHQLIVERSHGGYDSHGDLKPDLLDYLERLERQTPRTRSLP